MRSGRVARLLGRRSARVALGVLLALYSLAVYAPLIAGDRPLFLSARDVGAARTAREALAPLADGWERALARGDVDAAERERSGLDARLATLERGLADADTRRILTGLRGELAEREVDLADVARRAQAASAALEGDDAARHVALLRTSPALAALSPSSALFMAAWTLLLGAALFRARAPLRLAGLCAVASLGAWPLFDAPIERGGASLKQRLQAGELQVERALLPLFFYGVAEIHESEPFRPPTWLAGAARDEQGRARDARAGALAGLQRAATPIEVRWGEPARNAPRRHLLGTDALGRDLAVRLIWGARVSLVVGLAAAALLTAIGLLLGGLAGYLGGRTDALVSRAIELVLGFPALFLIVLAAAYTDPEVVHPLAAIVAIIALVAWTSVARLARSEMQRLRTAPFVLAARAQGLSTWRVLVVHALPNALSPVLVAAAFAVGGAILSEATVSFLGFGVRHPWPSWGALIGETRDLSAWWLQVFPGLALLAAVSAFNVLGEALRDALDPRLEPLP